MIRNQSLSLPGKEQREREREGSFHVIHIDMLVYKSSRVRTNENLIMNVIWKSYHTIHTNENQFNRQNYNL